MTLGGNFAYIILNNTRVDRFNLQSNKIDENYVQTAAKKEFLSIAVDQTSVTEPKFMFLGAYGSIHKWDLKEKKEVEVFQNAHDSFISQLIVAPGEDFLVSSCTDRHIKKWAIDPKIELDRDYGEVFQNYLGNMALFPTGDYIYVSDWDGNLKQYGIKRETENQFKNYGKVIQSSIFSIDIASNGKNMVVGDKQGNLK